MKMDCIVEIPKVKGKIVCQKGYVYFEYGREYKPDKKYNIPKRSCIGHLIEGKPGMMHPNANFMKYFPDVNLSKEKEAGERSHCLRIGAFIVIKKMLENFHIPEMLDEYFNPKDAGLFLDLVAYSIICESNAGQYYPDFAYNHPLFTPNMHIYSDAKVSRLLSSISADQSVAFLNQWNAMRDHREKIYISYDSTNKNCQAGDLELVEYGHPKVDVGTPIINYSMAYDTNNRIPLFYEEYPGSIVDVSQLQYMLDKAHDYGYRHTGFILDRGYFSKSNIQYMDQCNYEFIIMVKGKKSLVRKLILENKGTFEDKRACSIRRYKAYGTTIKDRLYEGDAKDRYFHLFYSDIKRSAEREALEARMEHMSAVLKKMEGRKVELGDSYRKYFEPVLDKDGTVLTFAEKDDVIEEEIGLCGYYVIVTSEAMSAREALELYKSRDTSEKLFRSDKSFLGNSSLRVMSDASASAKSFIYFVALIVRCRIYTLLKDAVLENNSKANYMTVPAALRELEKIEMIRMPTGRYRLAHATTATQKNILSAFGVDSDWVKKQAHRIADLLEKQTEAIE